MKEVSKHLLYHSLKGERNNHFPKNVRRGGKRENPVPVIKSRKNRGGQKGTEETAAGRGRLFMKWGE